MFDGNVTTVWVVEKKDDDDKGVSIRLWDFALRPDIWIIPKTTGVRILCILVECKPEYHRVYIGIRRSKAGRYIMYIPYTEWSVFHFYKNYENFMRFQCFMRYFNSTIFWSHCKLEKNKENRKRDECDVATKIIIYYNEII